MRRTEWTSSLNKLDVEKDRDSLFTTICLKVENSISIDFSGNYVTTIRCFQIRTTLIKSRLR
jgi:hypothetical protein